LETGQTLTLPKINTSIVDEGNTQLEIIRQKMRKKLKERPDILEKMKAIDSDPILHYQAPAKAISDIALAKKLLPDLFLTPQEKYAQHKGGWVPAEYKEQLKVTNKLGQLGVTGVLKGPLAEKRAEFMDKGYLPEIRDTNWLGDIRRQLQFPLDKLLQTIGALARTPAAMQQQVQKKAMASGDYVPISEFNLENYDVSAQAKKNINPLNAIKQLTGIGKEGWKEVAKATFEPIYNQKSKYRGFGFDVPNTELLKGTDINKTPMEAMQPFLEKWKTGNPLQRAYYKFISETSPNEQGNWWQRLTSGFVGTPLDAISFGEDVAFDISTYVGGGLAKGAKTGFTLGKEAAESAVGKILKEGAEIGLTKAGRIGLGEFKAVNKVDDIVKAIKEGNILPSAIKEGITGTDDAAKSLAIRITENKAVQDFLKEIPDVQTASKYIDLGGTKVFGTTIIPGYKYTEMGKKFENTKLGSLWQKLFNAQAGIPQEFRIPANFAQSISEADVTKLKQKFAQIITKRKPNEADLEAVQKFFGLQADIERAGTKIENIGQNLDEVLSSGIQEKLFGKSDINILKGKGRTAQNLKEKYINLLNELTSKQQELAEDLKLFAQDVAQQFKTAGGEMPNTLEWYAPIRYDIKKEAEAVKKSLTGTLEQPFQKLRKISTEQAKGLKLENKDLITSWNQRLWEQEKSLFRTRLINESRQFVSDVEKPGYSGIKNIPELEGKYLPDEYVEMFQRTYRDFFGDQAFNKLIKAYDKSLTIWKRLVLFTPGYDIRNFITDNVSGLMQWGMDYLNPRRLDTFKKIMSKEHVPIKLFNGKTEYADEIYAKIFNNGVLATQTAYETGALRKFSPTQWKFTHISNPRENFGRVIGYLIERENGASDLMASAITKGVFFDYLHSMTAFDNNIAKRFLNPFWSWQKNNIRRQFELLFTRTGQYAAIPKAMNFMENISDVPEGYDEFKSDTFRDLAVTATPFRAPGLPDWLAELLNRPKTEKAGNMLAFNPNMAFQDWSRLNPVDAASSLPPNIKILAELIANKNLYYGTPIYGKDKYGNEMESKPVNSILQKILGLIPGSVLNNIPGFEKTSEGTVNITPLLQYLAMQWPQYALAQRGFSGTENSPYQNLSALAGVKFFPYNEEKQKTQYINDWLEDTRGAISDYERKNATKIPSPDEIVKTLKEMYKEMAAQQTGYNQIEELKKQMDLFGGTKEERLLVKLLSQPYEEKIAQLKDINLTELLALFEKEGIKIETGSRAK